MRSVFHCVFGLVAVVVAGCTSSEMANLDPAGAGGGAGTSSGAGGFAIPIDGSGGAIVGMPMPAGGATGTAACGSTSAGPALPPMPIRMPFGPVDFGTTVRAETAPPPLSGGTLHALANGQAAVVSDPDRDRLYVVDLVTRKVRADIALSAKDEPGRIAEDKAGRVHVALRGGGALLTVEPATGTISARRSVCTAPRGVAYELASDLVHVACANGELVSLPAGGGPPTRTVTLERDLRDIVVSGTNLLVSKFRSAEVLVVGSGGAIVNRMKPPARQRAPVMEPGFPGSQPRMQTLSAAVAWRMQPMAGGGAIVIHQRGVDDELAVSPGGYAGGKDCGGAVETVVSTIVPGQPTVASPAVALSVLPIDLAVSPDGTRVAFVSAGNSTIPGMPQVSVSSIVDIATPRGGDCMFPTEMPPPIVAPEIVVKAPPGQVVAVAYAPDGNLLVQSREPAALYLGDSGQLITLSNLSRADIGQTIFHANAGGGIACASCHPEGGEDGRVWTFACIGPRRTQSMRGGIGGTEPFHWDGDMTTFGRLVHEVFEGRMAGPPLEPAQSDALLGWIDRLPNLPSKTVTDSAAVGRGRALFNDTQVACATCHGGARLTNNAHADVGTGKMFQVPSLLNVGARAPFIHDGCAPTLMDRFGGCGGGDKHGKTSHLTSGQLDDLVSYLETL